MSFSLWNILIKYTNALESATDISAFSNMHLRDDLGIDSLSLVELVMDMEEKLGVVVSDVDYAKFETIGDLLIFFKTEND